MLIYDLSFFFVFTDTGTKNTKVKWCVYSVCYYSARWDVYTRYLLLTNLAQKMT